MGGINGNGKPDDPGPREILATARRYVAAGCSVIPLKTDGSKAPAIAWKDFQAAQPLDSTLVEWFGGPIRRGIGIPCGIASGNLIVLDNDSSDVFEEYCEIVKSHDPDLYESLPIIRTPGGGNHIPVRCEQEVEGNQKLALRAVEVPEGTKGAKQDGDRWILVKVIFETREQGGQIVAPGGPLSVHATGKPYLFIKGSIEGIPTVTKNQLDFLLNIARNFNEYHPREEQGSERADYKKAEKREADGLRPGDDYNVRGDVESVLLNHGWTVSHRRGSTVFLRKPGARGRGHHATLHAVAHNVFYNFSTSVVHFDDNHGYSAFEVYTRLEHNNDHTSAARALAALGYGAQRERKEYCEDQPAKTPRQKPREKLSEAERKARAAILREAAQTAEARAADILGLTYSRYLGRLWAEANLSPESRDLLFTLEIMASGDDESEFYYADLYPDLYKSDDSDFEWTATGGKLLKSSKRKRLRDRFLRLEAEQAEAGITFCYLTEGHLDEFDNPVPSRVKLYSRSLIEEGLVLAETLSGFARHKKETRLEAIAQIVREKSGKAYLKKPQKLRSQDKKISDGLKRTKGNLDATLERMKRRGDPEEHQWKAVMEILPAGLVEFIKKQGVDEHLGAENRVTCKSGVSGAESTDDFADFPKTCTKSAADDPVARGIWERVEARHQRDPERPPPVKCGPAIWRNADHDEPVTVLGECLPREPSGRRYVRIEGSNAGVPLDEIFYDESKPFSQMSNDEIFDDIENSFQAEGVH
jgi:hypothetical protein